MYSYRMSYSEFLSSLSLAIASQRTLTSYELKCLQHSLHEPVLQKMLSLYPLPAKIKQFLESAEAQARLEAGGMAQPDFNVHSFIYGGAREKTDHYLNKEYSPNNIPDVLERLEAFLQELLLKPKAQKALIEAEAERYQMRQEAYSRGTLVNIAKQYSLEEIQSDFTDYLEYLRCSKNAGSTYAWNQLSALLQRLASFTKAEEKDDAAALLLAALDDSRTAYHLSESTYVTGKHYTCLQGLQDRLLDYHAFIVPTAELDTASECLMQLAQPFVLHDLEMQQEGVQRTFSQLLYALYFRAAGYQIQKVEYQAYDLATVDKNALRSEYLELFNMKSQFEKSRTSHTFNAAICSMSDFSCEELEAAYPKIISYLKEKNLLIKVIRVKEDVIAPTEQKTKDEVIFAMLESGPFIDKSHLDFVLAIQDRFGGLDGLEAAAQKNAIPAPLEGGLILTKNEMMQIYQEYLEHTTAEFLLFYPFFHEDGLNSRLFSENIVVLGCFQNVLCDWLDRNIGTLDLAVAEKIAFLCAAQGYSLALRKLCERVSPDYIDTQQNLSLLHLTSNEGHAAAVEVLIQCGANIDLPGPDGMTALMLCCQHGHVKVAEILLNAKANLYAQTVRARVSALGIASQKGHFKMVKLLLEAGADPDSSTKSGVSALMIACGENHIETARVLIEAKANINAQTQHGTTALMIASQLGHIEAVKFLLDCENIAVNSRNNQQESALSIAAWAEHKEVVNALIAAGANPNIDARGATVLMIASMSGRGNMVQVLLKAGANPFIAYKGQTPLDWLLDKGHIDVAQAFSIIENPNVELEQHALQVLQSGNAKALSDLLESSPELNINRFSNGQSALDIAIEANQPAMVAMLVAQERLTPWFIIEAVKQPHLSEAMLRLLLSISKVIALIQKNKVEFEATTWMKVKEIIENRSYPQDGFNKLATDFRPELFFSHSHSVRTRQLAKRFAI